jgi:dTDP-4-dehydrorhamnose 3,5-epimerase
VNRAGELLEPRIEGLVIRDLIPCEDERGTLVELLSADWGFHPTPVTHTYLVSARPRSIRGWVMHLKQDDRIAILQGAFRWGFFDDREGSASRGRLNVFTFSEQRRRLILIPAGIWHAVENVGLGDASFINMPTRPYDHAAPDKYFLPLKNDLIPFSFGPTPRLEPQIERASD